MTREDALLAMLLLTRLRLKELGDYHFSDLIRTYARNLEYEIQDHKDEHGAPYSIIKYNSTVGLAIRKKNP
jgi:hypothetical protein